MIEFATITEAIAYYANATPNKACLIDANSKRQLSYLELWQLVQNFAKRLRAEGLQKGDRVVVHVGPLLETFVAQFGVYLAGGVYCPVEKNMKKLKLLEMINHFDAAFLISKEEIKCDVKFINLSELLQPDNKYQDGTKIEFPNPEELGLILYTTGTTGKSKGVMLRNNAPSIRARAKAALYEFTSDDVFLWLQPLHLASGAVIFGPSFLTGGTAVWYGSAGFISDFFQAVREYRVTVMHLPASIIKLYATTVPNAFKEFEKQLKVVSIGTAVIYENEKNLLCSLLPNTRLFNSYGSTEVWPISYLEFSRYKGKPNCVGSLFPETRFCLLDSDKNVIVDSSKENAGMIACGNSSQMIGYWREQELTEQVFFNDMIILTDVGYIGSDGFLYLLGRANDIIISGGIKIAPYEIENVVLQMPEVESCACIAQPDRVFDNIPKLFVVMKKECEFSAKRIADFLSERLEQSKCPRIIRQIDALPVIPGNNKIDRKALKNLD